MQTQEFLERYQQGERNFTHNAHLLRANLQGVYLLWADLSEANLRGADLRGADLSGAYLRDSILSEADLRDSFLIEGHLIRTNLEGANLTGSCIHNWHLEDVELAKIECQYIFTQFNYNTKMAGNRSPANRDFHPGEFGQQYGENSSMIEVKFTEPPLWPAVIFTLAKLEADSHELTLTLEYFEMMTEQCLLKIRANHIVNIKIIAQQILALYSQMKPQFIEHRSHIFNLLNITPTPPPKPKDSVDSFLPPAPPSPPPLSPAKRSSIYQEVFRQIRAILLSQEPEIFFNSVERLLSYLNEQGVSTETLQKKVISQVLLQRAKQDEKFKKHLQQWHTKVDNQTQNSTIGKAVQSVIKRF